MTTREDMLRVGVHNKLRRR